MVGGSGKSKQQNPYGGEIFLEMIIIIIITIFSQGVHSQK
jgi:hypothetical protein